MNDTTLDEYNKNHQDPGEKSITDEEVINALNIPERDEEKYPLPSKKDMEEAGSFMFKLNLMASSVDLNLQSLVWELYINMNNFLNKDVENSSINLAQTLEDLKEYLSESNNIIFKDLPENVKS